MTSNSAARASSLTARPKDTVPPRGLHLAGGKRPARKDKGKEKGSRDLFGGD